VGRYSLTIESIASFFAGIESFEDVCLTPIIKANIELANYTTPTPVQVRIHIPKVICRPFHVLLLLVRSAYGTYRTRVKYLNRSNRVIPYAVTQFSFLDITYAFKLFSVFDPVPRLFKSFQYFV
jgi:hypothetical protein